MLVLKTVIASLAIAAGVLGSLMFVVFLLAGTANSSTEDARHVY